MPQTKMEFDLRFQGGMPVLTLEDVPQWLVQILREAVLVPYSESGTTFTQAQNPYHKMRFEVRALDHKSARKYLALGTGGADADEPNEKP